MIIEELLITYHRSVRGYNVATENTGLYNNDAAKRKRDRQYYAERASHKARDIALYYETQNDTASRLAWTTIAESWLDSKAWKKVYHAC